MNITIIPVGLIGTNCYFAAASSGNCAVIDPGAQPEKLIAALREKKLTPTRILITHGHHDHIGGLKRLMAEYPDATVHIGAGDLDALENPEESLAMMRGKDTAEYTIAGGLGVREGDTLTVDELEFKVLETPGHTKGGVCYLCGDVLFAGDTIFYENCGRCDLPGGDFEVMKKTLNRLAALEGDYTVYPGHERASTMEHERARNPYIGL